MRIWHLVGCFTLLAALAAAPSDPARAAAACRYIGSQELAGAMPGAKWSFISDQDGRGCIFTGGRGDTLMLTVFRNPTPDRARESYDTFIKTLAERMPAAPVSGIGDDAQSGITPPKAAQPEAAIVSLSGEYILSMSIHRSGRPPDDALLKQLTELARRAIGNVGLTNEIFGGCEWLTAADAEGFLDSSTLTVERTGPGSCLIYDGAANTMMVAVVAMSHDTQVSMMNRNSPCQHVPLPELGRDAFAEHSCSKGNTNAVNIYVWKNGKQASILFAPTKPHPESGSVEHLKAVAARVYQKM
jgi:hypothetical protein